MTLFGPILLGTSVTDAMEAHLKLWLPTYLAEMKRQHGVNLPAVRSYNFSSDVEKWPERQLPAVLVVSSGTADEPTMDGGGAYTATYTVGVGVVAAGRSEEETLQLAQAYAAAVRACVVQHPSLGGFALGTRWLGEEWDTIESSKARTLVGAQEVFVVTVKDVTTAHAGPGVPNPAPNPNVPSADWPTVATHSEDIQLTT